MDALVAWLREQLAEDERVAHEASWASPEWREESSWLHDLRDPLPSQRARIAPGTELLSEVEARHIARWDPARVLAEVEAKRQIMDRWEAEISTSRPGGQMDQLHTLQLRLLARVLAQPYAARPGFKDEWRLT